MCIEPESNQATHCMEFGRRVYANQSLEHGGRMSSSAAELRTVGRSVDGSSGDLEALLHPMELEIFFDQYWNEKALFLPGCPGKFSGLFDRVAFDLGLQHCVDLKVGYTDDKGWPAHFNIRPEQVEEMLRSGKTVCASGIDSGDPKLTAFLKRISEHFAVFGRLFFNSYLSPDNAGFGLHLDHHPVMILQIEGRKRWWYSREPGLREVLTNVSFPHDRNVLKLPWVTVTRPDEASLSEVILNPGDILYMPKGTWHRAQAIGGSLGLTLAMESASPLELIQYALGPHLNKVEFRNALPGYWVQSTQEGMPAELHAQFDKALAALRSVVQFMTPSDLYQVWRQAQAARTTARGRQ